MRRLLTVALMVLGVCGSAVAQEGHPLKGSWIGEWSGNDELGDFVLLVMDWDGDNVTGMINPGTDNIEIEEVDLDPTDWSLTIKAGDYEITGKIMSLELPSRSIVGEWEEGRREGRFEISRQ